ncbi:membrane-associated phospholipid phosphatase [Halovivax ruber XH-70]|uniref:Membrane-associated phospholipid phosphatase n=1 Tax=Halovivax ruber (strain DSM 18193 / JCM 13892 / XH-70) TaxID=797302 RepID=L0I8R9_HALRX|nr:phosphatase PAP2 family protein [Halovivax ruber]AGB15104.1 membrane-associated phospholipid phosphatase [Halovivax ruber XH-70]
MALSSMLVVTVIAVAVGFVGTCALCLDRGRVRHTVAARRGRVRELAPYVGAAGFFLLAKFLTSEYSVRLSQRIGWNITDEIYAVEGEFVAVLQRVVPDVTVEVFSALYMFGFPYLLATAPILYVTMSSLRRFKELLVAYLLNYVVGGVALYTLFIAYGPRNHLDSVEGLMYDFYPQTQDLTAAIADNTNVFPSLHTSLSVVVLLFAWRTRREFPKWFVLAAILVSGVVFSTMYLGIHWAIDVVAGIVLALWSVAAAEYIVGSIEGERDRRSVERSSEFATDPETGD